MSVVPGFDLWPGALGQKAQEDLVAHALRAAEVAPFTRYETAFGKTMSVAMSSFGPLGWISDQDGYRYVDRRPGGGPWLAMPQALLDLWAIHGHPLTPPDSGLINLYRGDARMSLHQDSDEGDRRLPVLSISLGDTALFRIGGQKRGDPTRSIRLASGDICRLAGPARMAFHGIDRVIQGSSRLVPGGGRINLTLRRARPADAAV